jgi:alpha-D-xyloside xylohydrolase
VRTVRRRANPGNTTEALTEDFRRALGLKYSLMPYIYAQAKDSSAHGYPMLRTLFFEYPNDPTSWTIDDEYMFGSNLLVAPLIEPGDTRKVYLPRERGSIIRQTKLTKGPNGTTSLRDKSL